MGQLISDVSALTSINEKLLNKFIKKVYYSIADSIYEAISSGQSVVELDLEVGNLYINTSNNTIQYKFIPSNALQEIVKDIIINGANVLEDTLETSLVDKITNAYKELL